MARTPTLTVVMLDLDRFKMLNDRHGHAAGDEALKLFTRLVRSQLSGDEMIGRWGGEEFIVLLPGSTAADAVVLLERIRASAVTAHMASAPSYRLDFSAGVAVARETRILDHLVAMADAALYDAKMNGRGRTLVSAEMA
jgi:diguanylate cyclase (GGDEF)-like protein